MSNPNFLNSKPNTNGKTKHALADMMGFVVIGSFLLLGGMLVGALMFPDKLDVKIVYDYLHTITIMSVGAFLALAKDILNPRREITINEVMELVKAMANNQNGSARGQGNKSNIRQGGS